jgi:putative membrane protein
VCFERRPGSVEVGCVASQTHHGTCVNHGQDLKPQTLKNHGLRYQRLASHIQMNSSNPILRLLAFSAIVLAWSLVHPSDYWVWLFEISAGIIGLAVLAATYRRFPFSRLVYLLVGIHFAVLAIAARYTYAEMPLFNWLRDPLGLTRNHYDRVGHFFQGFVPALITREILIRLTELKSGKLLGFLCISVCLAFSAFWELLEWWMAVAFYRETAAAWLGMQGDPWDAQWDMFMALCGATAAIAFFSGVHDRSMAEVA